MNRAPRGTDKHSRHSDRPRVTGPGAQTQSQLLNEHISRRDTRRRKLGMSLQGRRRGGGYGTGGGRGPFQLLHYHATFVSLAFSLPLLSSFLPPYVAPPFMSVFEDVREGKRPSFPPAENLLALLISPHLTSAHFSLVLASPHPSFPLSSHLLSSPLLSSSLLISPHLSSSLLS